MKKMIYLVMFLGIIFLASSVLAWNDCPKGEINDPAPGDCSLYVDTDNNGICDHSEPAPEDRSTTSTQDTNEEISLDETGLSVDKDNLPELSGKDLKSKTVSSVAEFYEIDEQIFVLALENYLNANISNNNTFQFLHDNYGAEPSEIKELVMKIKNGNDIADYSPEKQPNNAKKGRNYYFGTISITLIIIYLLSYLLSKYKYISLVLHRRLWNILLLITFLVSGIFGLILTIRINYGITTTQPFNMLFWHVEAGIAMSLISIFHILWHLPYFKAIFKKVRT